MPSHAGKKYVSDCPNCSSLLKEVSPIPFCRCHACNSFLIVKRWKLEDEVSIKNESHEKHTPKEKSENPRLNSKDGSISTCSEIDCDGEKEDASDKSCNFSSEDKQEKGFDLGEAEANVISTSVIEGDASLLDKIDSFRVGAGIEEDCNQDEEKNLAEHNNLYSKARRVGECDGDGDEPSLFSTVMLPSEEAHPCHLRSYFIEMDNGVEQVESGQTIKKCNMSENEIKVDDGKNYDELHERSFYSNAKGGKSEATRIDKEMNKQVDNSESMQERGEPMKSSTWFIASGKKSEDQCFRTGPETNSQARKVAMPAADGNVPRIKKPVSMRTFRCRMEHGFGNIPEDHQKAKTNSAVESMQVVPAAAKQSPGSWEAQSLNSTTESILYPRKCDFSDKDHILTSYPDDGFSEVSSNSYSTDKWVSADEDVVSNAVNSPTPSLSSALFISRLNEDCVSSPGNNETSSKSPIPTPVSEDEVVNVTADICTSGKSIFASEDVNVASEAEDLDQYFTPSSEPCSSSSTPLSISSPIPSSMHGDKVSGVSANVCSQGKSVFTNKDFLSEAADLEQTSPSSSASHSLTGDGMLSPGKFESSARNLFLPLHPKVAASEVSAILERPIDSNNLLDAISEMEDLDRRCSTSPVASSEMFSLSNQEPSPTNIILTSPKDEGSSVSTNICSPDNSIVVDKNANEVSKTVDLEQKFNLISSLELCGLTAGHVLSPSNHKFSDEDLILTTPKVDVSDVSADGCSLENGTKPKTDIASTIKPQEGDGSTTDRQNDHSSTKGKDGYSRRQVLLNKLDEMRDEIGKSMEKRKTGNKPHSTKDSTERTKKPMVRKCDFGQEYQQPLANPYQLQKATKHKGDPYHDISPSSSSSCSSVVTKYELCATCAKSSHLYHGNRKVVYGKKRRSQNRNKGPLEKSYFKSLLGGSPYISCYKCTNLLQLPMGFQFVNRRKKLQCGSCLGILSIALLGQNHIALCHRL